MKNNKDKIKMEIKGEIKELSEYYYNKEIRNAIIEINLIGIKKVTNMSYMFHGCYSLTSLPDISKFNTTKVNNMSSMFSYYYQHYLIFQNGILLMFII